MTALPAFLRGSFSVCENGLFLFACIRQRPGRPAPAVGDIGDEHVAALNHPFVSAQNSVSPRHRFQRRINRLVVAFRRHGAVEIGKHQNQADVGMPTLQPMQHVGAQAVERTVAAQIKLGRPVLDQPFADIGQPHAHLRAVRDLAVTAKGNNQSDHPPAPFTMTSPLNLMYLD